MYQCLFFDRTDYTYYLRDDKTGWSNFKFSPPRYKLDPEGEYPTLDGKRANKLTKFDYRDKSLYESDLDPQTAVLIDKYYKSDDVPSWHDLVYFDIECEIAGALTPELIKRAPTKITSIAIYDNNTQKHYCLILDEGKKLEVINEESRSVIPFDSEHDLLYAFLNLWEELDPTIVSGYNSEYFDIPFLYYRIKNQLGEVQALRLSPLRKVKYGSFINEPPVIIAGINHLDYMLLIKKYITKQEPSYKLGDIGTKYVELGKIEYEGNLDRLFKEDVNKFIAYNIRDVEILIELEKKLKFIELTISICHLCHVTYDKIFLSTTLNDGAILTYLKRKGIVSPNKPTTNDPSLRANSFEKDDEVKSKSGKKFTGYIQFINPNGMVDIFCHETNKTIQTYISNLSKNEEYAGGYLLDPKPGLYEWLIDNDYSSLYPSIIRSLNLGIETYVGRILERKDKNDCWWGLMDLKEKDPKMVLNVEDKEQKVTQITVEKLIRIIEENKLTIAASGAMFRTDIKSIVCDVLEDWFNKRKIYKSKMKEAYMVGDKTLGDFYHRQQQIFKIKLNDVYGSYAINGWRYTDGRKILSSAITLSGQRLIKESIKEANNIMEELLES
jgi:DNA polymerase elongation subunit (family B)